jgi:hypothetical protein
VRRLCPVLLGALALAGCGGSSSGLLTDQQAQNLLDEVDAVEQALSDQKCVDARQAAQAGERRARALPKRVDDELKRNLVEWFEHVEQRVQDECERPEPEPTAEPTVEPTVEPTEEPTAEPTAEPTEEPTATPTPDTGGNQSPDGQTGVVLPEEDDG